jgi:hypothetical protein
MVRVKIKTTFLLQQLQTSTFPGKLTSLMHCKLLWLEQTQAQGKLQNQ